MECFKDTMNFRFKSYKYLQGFNIDRLKLCKTRNLKNPKVDMKDAVDKTEKKKKGTKPS